MKKLNKILRIIEIGIVVALALWAIYSFSTQGIFFHLFNGDFQAIHEHLTNQNLIFGLSALLFLTVVEVVLGFIPGALFYPIGGIIFGGLVGGLVILIGNIIGSIISYDIGAKVSDTVFNGQKKSSRIRDYLRDRGVFGVFLLRLNPITSYDIIVHIAGGLKLNFKKVILANTLGLIPYIFILTYLGEDFLENFLPLLKILLVVILIYIIYLVIKFLKSNGDSKGGKNSA